MRLLPVVSGVAPPDMPLLPPWGTIGTSCAEHSATSADTSCVLDGEARPIALPVNLPRQSVSHGSTNSGSVVKPRGPSRSATAPRKEAS